MLRRLVLLTMFIKVVLSFSDIGKWDLPMSGKYCSFEISKSLFKDTKLIIVLHCEDDADTNLTVSYKWRPTWCSPDYYHYFEKQIVTCTNMGFTPYDLSNASNVQELSVRKTYICNNKSPIIFSLDDKSKTDTVKKETGSSSLIPPLLVVEAEGTYALGMTVQSRVPFKANLHVEMVAPSGYLSAAMWPLLPFFGTMCAVYTILCALWMLVCALQWRDLLRIQYWIGGVALLGMVESSVYYSVYSSINRTGLFILEAYVFAEWVSVAKRALARMLVIIVSLGFGIVKPRLGPALQRVVASGLLWALLAAIEAWLRLHRAAAPHRDLLLAEAPLSLLDSALCWWAFVALAHTTRTLQLRRNTIKLSLYRHFTNTLILAVTASVIFMLYSLRSYRILECITDWKSVWLDEAYWHMLFAGVLTAIMVLWRPTNNNQRYAFTPLLDNAEDDDDEEEQFVNDAYGVKMRGVSVSGDSSNDARDHPENNPNTLESDLRWVEENIPTSTLPVLDSDEEIINTKFEVSKMQ